MTKIDFSIDALDLNMFEKNKKITQILMNEFYEIEDKKSKNKYTAKIPFEEINDFSKEKLLEISHNIEFLSNLDHPSILKYIGFSPIDFCKDPKPVVITENIYNSLSYFFSVKADEVKKIGWTETKKLILIYGIASAMSYLHSHNIIHCNLNPDNIFLDENFFPKISGFEFSKLYINSTDNSSSRFSLTGCPAQYQSLEVLNGRKYSKASDVYAFSIIVYELFANCKPFPNFRTTLLQYNDVCSTIPTFSSKIPSAYQSLILRCWERDPRRRLTFDQIVDALRNDPKYITDEMSSDGFFKFVDMIDNSPKSFMNENQFHHLDRLIESAVPRGLDMNGVYSININSNFESFDLSGFKMLHCIGNHVFEEIYEMQDERTGSKLNARLIKPIKHCYRNEVVNITREINIRCKLNHPSIEKFFGYSPTIKNSGFAAIITEFLSYGSLEDILKMHMNFHSWDDTQKLITIYGIAAGMSYLHSHDIIHRDLKPENIQFNELLLPKISGFNISVQLDDMDADKSEIKGTPIYLAPEIFTHKKYSKASDVYSFAFIVYEIYSGKIPFVDCCNPLQIRDKVVRNVRPSYSNIIPKSYWNLIENCWSKDPSKRPTFDQIATELKTNTNYITPKVNFYDFKKYVKFIEESEITFDQSKRICSFDSIISSKYELFPISPLNVNVTNVRYTEIYNIPLDFQYIDITQFEKLESIGFGSYSNVYEIKDKKAGKKYAAKYFNININKYNKKDIESLKREITIISKINHPSIVKFYGYCSKPVAVFELLTNRSIETTIDLIREGNYDSDFNDTKMPINIYGIASGMAYLHSFGIIHRDLKPSNVLFDDYLFPKIIDFGLAKFLCEKPFEPGSNGFSENVGTSAYMSPEAIENSVFSKPGDVYSFAILVYTIITKSTNFERQAKYNITKKNNKWRETRIQNADCSML